MGEYKVIMRSGKEYPITKAQRDYILQKSKLIGGNFPYYELKDPDVILFYKHISEFVIDEYVEPEVEQPKAVVVEAKEAEPTEDSDSAEIEARRQAILDEMIAKSSCKHEDKEIYYIETLSKKGKMSLRYFPVCTFCGQRFRFTKAEDLTDEEKENAKVWIETT